MPIRGRLRHLLPDAIAVSAAVLVVVLSLTPFSVSVDLALPVGVDKIGHFLSYSILGFCALYRRYTLKRSSVTAAAIVSLGAVIEIVQTVFDRTSDINDFFANCLGVAFAWIAVGLFRWVRQGRDIQLLQASHRKHNTDIAQKTELQQSIDP